MSDRGKWTTYFCFDRGRQAFLGRCIGRPVDAGIGKGGGDESGFRVQALEAAVDVVLVKTRPNACAKLLRLGQAGDVGGRGTAQALLSGNDNDDTDDNDTLREVHPTIVSGLAQQA